MVILRSSSCLLLFALGTIYSLSFIMKIDALRPVEKSLFVVFGRPGSGKTTVANQVYDDLSCELNNRGIECVALDLDVCVTQLMRDNFGKGIYPTLEERKVFAVDACDYVDDQLADICKKSEETDTICGIISFSFVNTDLRDIFRARFPSAEWILIDTDEKECTKRIEERQGHFYKGEVKTEDLKNDIHNDSTATKDTDEENSEWKFAPVMFPHMILDGLNSVEHNARMIVEKILDDTKLKKSKE